MYEFRYGGEYQMRPEPGAAEKEWTRYVHLRENRAGRQREWWFHRDGCRAWFLAERDTVTNQVSRTFRAGENPSGEGSHSP